MSALNLTSTQGLIFSDGWRVPSGGEREVRNPADGALVGRIGVGDPADVDRACAMAASAQPGWGLGPASHRKQVLLTAAAALAEARAEVVSTLIAETGSTRGKAEQEITKSLDELSTAAALTEHPTGELLPHDTPGTLSMARRIPVGVVGVIAPWNAPLLLAMRSVAPALALGNAVVLKPDPKAALSGGWVIARIFERAGLPSGVLHIVPGGPETGEALVADPRVPVISFTGSSAAGRRVGAAAGALIKRAVLELGGNNPVLVLDDADLDAAVNNAAWGSFLHQGQICMATGRHLVHESLADAYVEKITAKAEALRIGDPADPTVNIGPLINEDQAGRVEKIVNEAVSAGARLVSGGIRTGTFFTPTVLADVDPTSPAFTEEIFGPVIAVTPFTDDDHAVALANSSEYGLSAAVHTRDFARGLVVAGRIRAGMVHVNGQTINDAAHIPMGGLGGSGNGGRHGGHWNLDEFTHWQWVTASPTAPTYPI
ncbi:aldehyde dehydrogenase family protein [Streptomyces sp. NPDC054770]